MSILDRHRNKFHIEQGGPITNGTPCCIWHGAKTGGGYPKVRDRSVKAGTSDVHRLVCEEANGPPPPGKWDASHICGTRSCVNPGHLEWELHRHNMWRINRDPDQELNEIGRLVPIRDRLASYEAECLNDFNPDDAITAFS